MKRRKTDPRIARSRRDNALARGELRTETQERTASAGVTSFPIKVQDPQTRAAIDNFLAQRGQA